MQAATGFRIVMLTGAFVSAASCVSAQDWPQWRGPNRDNKVVGFSEPKEWPKELAKKWRVAVGVGESSPALVGEKIYVFGRQNGEEVTRCLDASTGKEFWSDKYPADTVKGAAGGYPGPRSSVAVGEGKVCTLGVHGVVSCFDAATGKIAWRKDTKARPQFYTSSSPLIANGMCVVYIDALTAFDLKSGESKWKWSGAGTPYGSPVIANFNDVTQVVTPSAGLLVGVALADGKLQWQVKLGGGGDYTPNLSTPLVDGNTVYYSAAAKGKGGAGGASTFALKIEKKGDAFTATELWKKSFAADRYHAPVFAGGMIFGVSSGGRNFFCLDAKSGEQCWIDNTPRGQCGSILNAGSVLLALTADKDLVAFRPDGKRYTQLAKYRVSESETWCVPIVADNRIFVKDKGGSLTLLTLD